MKTYQEIKDIITKQLGLVNMAAYKLYTDQFLRGERRPTLEEIELLAPENIHNGHFWQVVEELFGPDCVANTNYGSLPNDIDEGNERNLALARMCGALNLIDNWRHYQMPVLEIGAGYGNFKQYLKSNTAMVYTGVDVFPKIRGVYPTQPNGLLPLHLVERTFHIIYSSNVFQHLSSKQRTQYFKDIHGMLTPNGTFIFNLLVPKLPPEQQYLAEDGKAYLRHYGQFTEVPLYNDFIRELSSYFYIQYETTRIYDSLVNFVCLKREWPVMKIDK